MIPQRPGHQLQGLLGAAGGQRVNTRRARRLHVQVGVSVPQTGNEEGSLGLKDPCPGSTQPQSHLDDPAGLDAYIHGLTRGRRRGQGAGVRGTSAERPQLGARPERDDARVPDEQVCGGLIGHASL